MYTEFIETGSLYAYARICALRLDPTAQKEIRTYATLVDELLSKEFPHAWAALRLTFVPEKVATVANATTTTVATTATTTVAPQQQNIVSELNFII
jgi:thymidylate synthase ThyX